MSDDWIIAIPSYRRADTLKKKTLYMLQQYSISPSKIYIFVASFDEKHEYTRVLDSDSYREIIIAKPGLMHARNFITNYFPPGQKIVNIDDDIRDFIQLDTEHVDVEARKWPTVKLNNLHTLIEKGFEECVKHNCGLWGIYPVANGKFMQQSITYDLRYIIGCFWGCINPSSSEKTMKITLEDKEDVLRTILYYHRDKAVVRINYIAPKTNYYVEKGGMQETRTKERVENSARWIVAKYPQYATYNATKKNGFAEVRLIRHAK
jgi:hypothetical protein